MKVLILILVLSSNLLAQIAPPTQMIKKRHGQSALVTWNFGDHPGILFFSIKFTPDLNVTPVEFKRVPSSERQTQFVVLFTPQNPKFIYYVISAVYDGTVGESFPSNTIAVERIGPPPN